MDDNRKEDKIKEIEKFLEVLISILPQNLDEYKNDFKTRLLCERHFEKIIEAAVDLAFLFIRGKKFRMPEDEDSAFDILIKEKIISEELGKKLKAAKGMRNFIVHQYGKIDDELVFHALTEELEKHVREFIENVRKLT